MGGLYNINLSEKAVDIDLNFIIRRLEQDGHTPKEATRSVDAYRLFLGVLAAEPNLTLVPTKVADLAWHEHILFMERYEADMLRLVGGRAYHYPEAPDDPVWQTGVFNTQDQFRKKFGIELRDGDFAGCYISVVAA